jgi:hypothetical protein
MREISILNWRGLKATSMGDQVIIVSEVVSGRNATSPHGPLHIGT